MKNRGKKKKVWEKWLCLDIICIMLILAGFSYKKAEQTTMETENLNGIYQKDSEEEMGEDRKENRKEDTEEIEEDTEEIEEGEDMETEKKKVALTFDDGPNSVYTPQMLEVLKKKGIKATFFLLGEQVEKYPEIVKQISDEGHLIGNHSYKHEQLSKLSSVQACTQVNRTNELIYAITGKYPEYLRPPFGDWKEHLDCEVNMIEVLWDVDTLDWSSKNKDKIIQKVVTNVEEGDIILMHDSYESTVAAVTEVIDLLQKESYEFVTVDELILE